MSTFRDAIAERCAAKSGPSPWNKADAVLDMPEMQAIRQWLRGFGMDGTNHDHCCDQCLSMMGEKYGVPDSVIAWVMDGDS